MENNEIILYKSIDGAIKVDVLFENETVWLSIDQLCDLFGKSRSTINEHILNIYSEQELFDRGKSTISEHIKNIFEEGELDENSVVRKFRTTAADGKDYDVT